MNTPVRLHKKQENKSIVERIMLFLYIYKKLALPAILVIVMLLFTLCMCNVSATESGMLRNFLIRSV